GGGAIAWTVAVDWGDGAPHSTYITTVAGAIAMISHAFPDNGTYTVTVTVTDPAAAQVNAWELVQTFAVGVANASPVVALANAARIVTVQDVAPTATLSNGGAVLEGSAGTASFSNQFDPSPTDVAAGFRYAYDFNDDGTFEIGDGTFSGSSSLASAVVPAGYL